MFSQELKYRVARLGRGMVRFAAFLREAEAIEESTTNRKLSWIYSAAFIVCLLGIVWLFYSRAENLICCAWVTPLVVAGYVRDFLKKRIDLRRSKDDALQAHYIALIQEFSRYSSQGTLAERIHPALTSQLEAAATSYFQVKDWLASKSSMNLLGAETHREVQQSIRRAMREVVFSVHGQYRPAGMQRKKWDNLVLADPSASEAAEDLARVCGLILQLSDIAKKSESLGKTITLMDRLNAVQHAIAELEETSYSSIKALPPRKS